MLLKADTVVELFARRIEADGPQVALGVKQGGEYRWLTWNEVAADVWRIAAWMVGLGVQPGDRVAMVSENRYEWIICDLAIQIARGVHVPIHPTLAGPQIAWQLKHCGCQIVFLSGPHQVAKLAPLEAELPKEMQWFAFDRCDAEGVGSLWRKVAHLGEISAAKDSRPRLSADTAGQASSATVAEGLRLEKIARRETTPESLATILYTSGTTGEPKGVMLTQGNLAINACSTIEAFGYEPEQVRINFLPLSHIFARTCDLYGWLAEGSRMGVAESRETVVADCQAIKPTCMNGVPYFYDKVYRALCAAGKQEEPGALKAILGGAVQRCCAGGAALPDHLYDYYHAHGVPLLQGYGLSESSPVISISPPTMHRRGSCGRPIPGIEVRIADDGEIMTRGPHVMRGYYKNEEATAEVLRDGWLATGDLGRMDGDGFLYITGRKKEILVTSGGKNIAPVFLESLLTEDPLILQAMVIGDARSYLTALLVPNLDVLQTELASRGVSVSRDEALMDPTAGDLYRARIDQRLSGVSPYEQVRKFTLLAQPFSIEAGELTPKLSLRRAVIGQRYAKEIEAMYTAGEVSSSKFHVPS
jgi:long-chain acyl-CoA synthetase